MFDAGCDVENVGAWTAGGFELCEARKVLRIASFFDVVVVGNVKVEGAGVGGINDVVGDRGLGRMPVVSSEIKDFRMSWFELFTLPDFAVVPDVR